MIFCPKCGAIVLPNKKDPQRVACSSCNYVSKQKKKISVNEKNMEKTKIEVIDKTIETLPKTEAECPICRHPKAFYWTAQTRSADEAETQFFKCCKCSHQWRQNF
ncbi:MAG TPA: transcription factor S [Candidatus Nanoarchaeia archaeon]|nr:transcription factor S [Candidatus Nanoarchaeia archaeon]